MRINRHYGAALRGTGRRTYYTSHADATGNLQAIKQSIDKGSQGRGDKQNFVMLADVGRPSNTPEYLFRSENRLLALDALGIPNERTTYIAVADKLIEHEQRAQFKKFLRHQVRTRGPFQHVLVVKGSDMSAEKRFGSGYENALSYAYSDLCEIVHETHMDRLALIMNLHQPFVSLVAEQERKKHFMAVKYFTSPIFRLQDIPIETLRYLEREMLRGEHDLTFGLLEASKRMYGSDSQQIVTLADTRVNPKSGRDKYYLPPLKEDGSIDLSYITDVLSWTSRHHKKPSQAIYTRSGSGHDAQLILESMRGREFDLTSIPSILLDKTKL
jgi:hypothetical protein